MSLGLEGEAVMHPFVLVTPVNLHFLSKGHSTLSWIFKICLQSASMTQLNPLTLIPALLDSGLI